jgi:hypothetical protein
MKKMQIIKVAKWGTLKNVRKKDIKNNIIATSIKTTLLPSVAKKH